MAVEKFANNSSEAFVGEILVALAKLDGVKGYKGDVTIEDPVTLEQLTKLNKATTGAITLDEAVDFVGTSTEILTAIAGDINFGTLGNIVITNNNYTLAQLNAISKAGAIELSNASVALSGSVDDLNILSGISNYAGAITVTGNYNLADLEAIDGFTTGKINVANKSVALEGAAANLAAMLPNLAGYKGAVTVLNAPTVAQLKAINNATAGSITLEDQSGDLSGSAADILAAFKGIKSYEGDIQVTGTDYKLADLKAINAITKGDLTVTTSTVALSGSAKDLAAALDGVTTYAGKVTVTGSYTVADLIDINAAVVDPNDLVLANKKVALTGKIADITAALAGIEDYAGAIKLTDVPADTAKLISVANLTKGKITLPANGHIDLTEDAAELQLLLAKINGAYKGDVTVSTLDVVDAVKALAQLKAINDATTGDVTVTTASPLKGSIKDIHAALKGITGFDAAVTVTDTKYTLAQLKTIVDSGDAAGRIILDVNAPLSGSVEDLNAVLAVATGYEGAITVTGTYTLTQLKDLDVANGDGAIKVANTSVALKGTAGDLKIVLSQLKGYKGAVTVTDPLADLEQLIAINNGTTGKITLEGTPATDLTGEASDILAAFKGIKSYAGNIEVTGSDYKLADLKDINAITEGDFTVAYPIALTGNAKDLAAALNGVVYNSDKVTVTGSYTVADLKAINTAVTGDVVLANKKVAVTGTAADIKLALAGITDYAGAIKVTDSSISEADLKAINDLTTGKITLPANGHDELSGTVSQVIDALQGVTGYKGTVTVTVDVNTTLAELQTILKSTVVKAEFNTAGPATTENTTLEGTAKEITAVLNKFKTEYIGKLTVTGSYTLADLVALNKLLPTDTGADVTLVNNVNLSGKSADIAAALSNVTGYAGKITLTDKPTLEQLVAINGATDEAIKIPTDTTLSGTTADVKAALFGIEGYKGNVNLTDSASAADLNTIAGLTTGVVKATLAADTTINDVTVTTTLANVKTSDVITLNSTVPTADATALIALNALVDTKSYALTKITEASTTENLVTVITNALAIKSNVAVEITGAISAADLNTIANLTTGVVTATLAANTAITDATVTALANVDVNDVISLTSSVTSADATALVALNALVDTLDVNTVTTITEVAGQVSSNGQNVVDALTIAGNDAAVTITGAISAAQLNAIAVTTGTVTATLAANTAITDATVTALANVNTDDVISLTSSVTSADATALVALAVKVSTADTTAFSSVTTITEDAGEVSLNGQNVVDALTIAGGDAAATITGAISAESVAAINLATTGLVTVSEVDVTGATFSLADLGDLAEITGLATIDATDTAVSAISLTLADLLASNDNAVFNIAVKLGAEDTLNLLTADGWDVSAVDANGNGTYTNGTQEITVSGSDDASAVVIA